jgi:hypothetical protein
VTRTSNLLCQQKGHRQSQIKLVTGNRDSLSEGPTESLSLPGGGELIVKNRRIVAPPITPFLISGDQFNSIGISINENK